MYSISCIILLKLLKALYYIYHYRAFSYAAGLKLHYFVSLLKIPCLSTILIKVVYNNLICQKSKIASNSFIFICKLKMSYVFRFKIVYLFIVILVKVNGHLVNEEHCNHKHAKYSEVI